MKNSKYEGHERIKDYRNMDMKEFHSKHGDLDGLGYRVIVGLLFFLAVLSWTTVRDSHPFNEPIVEARNDN